MFFPRGVPEGPYGEQQPIKWSSSIVWLWCFLRSTSIFSKTNLERKLLNLDWRVYNILKHTIPIVNRNTIESCKSSSSLFDRLTKKSVDADSTTSFILNDYESVLFDHIYT